MTWQGIFLSPVAVNWNDHRRKQILTIKRRRKSSCALCRSSAFVLQWQISQALCGHIRIQLEQSAEVKPGLVGLGQCEPWHAGFGQHSAKPWTDTKAWSLTVAGAEFRPAHLPQPSLPCPRKAPLSGRWLCGFPRLKLITCRSGVLTPVISTDAKLMNIAVIC